MRLLKVICCFILLALLTVLYSYDALGTAAPTVAPTSEPAHKVVYLTFDDGPCEHTGELLKLLEQENVKATFFLIGHAISDYPDAVRDIDAQGHAIGCHAFYHARKQLKTIVGFNNCIKLFNEALSKALDRPMDVHLFRFPYGSNWASRLMLRQIAESGYLWIDWNASVFDTDKVISHDPELMLKNAIYTSKDDNEIVLLMHENCGNTLRILPQLLQYYRSEGYTFDVLSPTLDHFIPGVHMGLPGNPKVR